MTRKTTNRFIVRFWSGETRTLRAKHIVQAKHAAEWLAKKYGLKLKTIGSA